MEEIYLKEKDKLMLITFKKEKEFLEEVLFNKNFNISINLFNQVRLVLLVNKLKIMNKQDMRCQDLDIKL